MVIMKCTDVSGVFFVLGGGGSGKGVTWEDISMEEFIMREDNFHEGGAGLLALFKKKKKIFNWK